MLYNIVFFNLQIRRMRSSSPYRAEGAPVTFSLFPKIVGAHVLNDPGACNHRRVGNRRALRVH